MIKYITGKEQGQDGKMPSSFMLYFLSTINKFDHPKSQMPIIKRSPMNLVSTIVQNFFDGFEESSNTLNLELLGSQYGDSFMFAGRAGAISIKKDDFLKVLPKRYGFFKTIGLVSSKITAIEETQLDKNYFLVRVNWEMRFEKDGDQPLREMTSATYVLIQKEDSLQIVFQLDHQDLIERTKELGLLPS